MADNSPPEIDIETIKRYAHLMMEGVPWASTLGFKVTDVERGRAFATAPWREDLVGDPDTGVIHGGVITALLDNICGVAVATRLNEIKAMATLDLRIDYMRPAEKGREIIGEAECYHITRSVAFTHAWAYHDSRDRIIASASGAFALNDPKRWSPGGGGTAAIARAAGAKS